MNYYIYSSLTFFCYSKVRTLNTNILVKPTSLADAGWWIGIDIQKISEKYQKLKT